MTLQKQIKMVGQEMVAELIKGNHRIEMGISQTRKDELDRKVKTIPGLAAHINEPCRRCGQDLKKLFDAATAPLVSATVVVPATVNVSVTA